MVKRILSEFDDVVLQILFQDLEQKIHHAEACLYHCEQRLRDLTDNPSVDVDLRDAIIEAHVFALGGYEDMQELKEIFQNLISGQYSLSSGSDPESCGADLSAPSSLKVSS